MKLILLRHGESQWNLENRFTGWKDVSLTDKGIEEANFSGKAILKMEISIDSVYTSILNRAIETTKIVTDILKYPHEKINYEWRLNERHYGALEGLNKSETAKKYGEEQVKIWRRSFEISPPKLNERDSRHPKFVEKFRKIDSVLPTGESLRNVIDRLNPFWKEYVDYLKKNSGNNLIIAHSNSLRAIIKMLENLTNNEIIEVNVPTGVPLVYNLDEKINVIEKKYLIDEESLIIKKNIVENQGKIK